MKAESSENIKDISQKQLRRSVVKSFIGFTLGAVGVVGGIKWLVSGRDEEGLPEPLRKVLNINQRIASGYFNNRNLAQVFPKERAAVNPRLNGTIGLESSMDKDKWILTVRNDSAFSGKNVLALTLDDIKKLPKTEITFDFKCIEGWSEISNWGGTKFSDFMVVYGLGGMINNSSKEEDLVQYVSLETPDKEYYVGLDIESALHPQTILCYEMNGKPLEPEHGAPLRLIVPSKYGIKSIKRIGQITFMNERPKDYWAERGYDFYAGL